MPQPSLKAAVPLIRDFIEARTGKTISDSDLDDLLIRFESYLINKVLGPEKKPEPPLKFADSRNMSGVVKEWLPDFNGTNKVYRIFDLDEHWVGKRLTLNDGKPGWEDHRSYLFLRREIWQRENAPPLEPDAELLAAFNRSSPPNPKECFSIDVLRKGIARTVSKGKEKRVRIPQSEEIRKTRAFQAIHLPDDEGCNSVLMAEPHAMKTFFQGDEEISFWWSEAEDVWVLWTDWVRWVIIF